jgi:hypothetical protein
MDVDEWAHGWMLEFSSLHCSLSMDAALANYFAQKRASASATLAVAAAVSLRVRYQA